MRSAPPLLLLACLAACGVTEQIDTAAGDTGADSGVTTTTTSDTGPTDTYTTYCTADTGDSDDAVDTGATPTDSADTGCTPTSG